MVARMIFCRLPKRVTIRSITPSGKPRHLGQQAVAARLEAVVEVGPTAREMERGGNGAHVEQFFGAQLGQRGEGIVHVPAVVVVVVVVLDHEVAVVFDVTHQLVELQPDEPGVHAQLHDVATDLLGDAPHHLVALEHGGDVAQRHQIFDFQAGQRRGHIVETALVALQRLQRLIGPVQQARISSSTCFIGPAYTVITPMSSLTEMTGTSIERATRSAVR